MAKKAQPKKATPPRGAEAKSATLDGARINFTKAELLKFYETMLLSRYVDDEEIRLKKKNEVYFQISGAGHEAIGIAAGLCMKAGHDWFYPYYRDRALMLQLGMTPAEMLMSAVGAEADPNSHARQMPSHWGLTRSNVPSSSSPTGTQFLQAVGCAEAGRYIIEQGIDLPAEKDEVTLVTTGDGTSAQGEFYEALNYACLKKLPVIFLVEDNEYAISVPVSEAIAGGNVGNLFTGFPRLQIFHVDGTDLLQSIDVMTKAVERARAQKGPALVHAKVTRPYSHSLSDDHAYYRTKAELADEHARDCITKFERYLLEDGIATEDELEAMRREARAAVSRASEEALAAPKPDPSVAMDHLYCTINPITEETTPAEGGEILAMGQAINRTMFTEMARDKRILIFGEDVADASREEILDECKGKGGVFKITYGLQIKYGKGRVFNSPLAEAGIIGRAVGLATRGLKPLPEIQFFDYIWPAMQQIRNEMATMRYRSGGESTSPAVIRVPIGGYLRGGAVYHSQTGETLFAKCPGIYIAYPSTARDAMGLLRAALRMDDPVLFLEHKHLYYQGYNRTPDPGPDYVIPFGKGTIRREGKDITLVTWGALVQRSLEAADRLMKEQGISVEVIDLRTVVPYDAEIICESVRKTSRCLVVTEEPAFAGLNTEMCQKVQEECFEWLDAPVRRLGAMNTWVAYSPVLEEAILPQVDDVYNELRALAAY